MTVSEYILVKNKRNMQHAFTSKVTNDIVYPTVFNRLVVFFRELQ